MQVSATLCTFALLVVGLLAGRAGTRRRLSAPRTPSGALTLQNAEALIGIAFVQMVREGTPMVYGDFTSNIDMRPGARTIGTPDFGKIGKTKA